MSDILQTILSRADLHHSRQDGESEFLTVLLQQAVAELGLRRLGVWIHEGQLCRLMAQSGDGSYSPPSGDQIRLAPAGGLREIRSQDGSSRHLLAASQIAGDSRIVLEAGEGSQPVGDEALVQLADIVADLQRRRMLETLLQSSRSDAAWQSLTAQLHSSLDNQVIANTVVTDTAALLPCRRIAIAERWRGHWNVVATTGVSEPDQRSDASRQIQQWIETAAAQTTPTDDSRPFVRALNTSGDWNNAQWAIVIESDDPITEDTHLDQFLQHASQALSNSDEATRRSATHLVRRAWHALLRPSAAVTLAVAAAVMGVLLLVQTDLRIEVYGELVPTNRQFVFAPDDGTVTELYVKDSSRVTEQDTLCVLTNEDLNGRAETIDGELAAAIARLAALDALRGTRRTENSDAQLLSAERAELEQKMKSLTRQSEIIARRLELLQVTPRITGRVYGDQLRQLLFQRPVQRGQYLMEVADPSAGWQLHLRIPEADSRYVLSALQESDQRPAITFALETSPERTRETTLMSLGAATDVDRRGSLSTLAIADLSGSEFTNERPGAGVVAAIHCGRHAVGFVWFRQVIEFVQRHTWL